MDTHRVHLDGAVEPLTLAPLERWIREQSSQDIPLLVRVLVWLREAVGGLLGWDREKKSCAPAPGSLYWSMTEAEKSACVKTPGQKEGPTVILWNDQSSIALEILNATCQAFVVIWLEGRHLCLAVFVIETKWWSRYYLALIEPFRKYIVYPGLVAWLESSWRRTHCGAMELS